MFGDEALNVDDVAEMLHVGRSSVYRLANSGELRSYKVGRKLRFTADDVRAFIQQSASSQADDVRRTARATRDAASASVQVASAFGASDSSAGLTAQAQAPASSGLQFSDETGTLRVNTSSEAAPGVRYLASESFSAMPRFTIAGTHPAADVLASALNGAGIPAVRVWVNDYDALVALYRGDARCAVTSLFDQRVNACNVPYVQHLAPGVPLRVIGLGAQEAGFVVRVGNPRRLRTWGALLREGVRLAVLPQGHAFRVLLDQKLAALEASREALSGYGQPVATQAAAVALVAAGAADVCVGCRADAAGVRGVEFFPLQTLAVDMTVARTPETRKVLRAVTQLAADEPLRLRLGRIEGLDAARLGVVSYAV